MQGSLVLIMTFITFCLVFYSLLGILLKDRNSISVRLLGISRSEGKSENGEFNEPLFTRVVAPALDNISKTVLKITPKEIVGALEKKIQLAGAPFKLSVKGWINIQVILVFCLPFSSAVIGYYKNSPFRSILLIIIAEIGVGLLLPNLVLSQKAAERQKKIQNSMPDVMDLLTVSVEAGLGFDGALAKVIDKMPGPLSKEFENALQEIKIGKPKKDALRDMADRIGVMDISTFVTSIIQADQFGVSIGNVLRIQSEQMRQKRRQRAQEKAMKAPIKMLFPIILFIFPTIFSVLLGPVIIRVIDVFSK